jgi:hypothetical protein
MSDLGTNTAAPVAAEPEKQEIKSPFEYIIAKYPNAPSEAAIQSFKMQVPGGRVRFMELPDGKRAVLLRAISGPELAGVQAEARKFEETKQLYELQVAVATKCTLWSSFTPGNKLTDQQLRASGAGLPVSLHAAIWDLSDYIDPALFDNLVIDL